MSTCACCDPCSTSTVSVPTGCSKGSGASSAPARCPGHVLGLAFKPDTDDVRESPAFPIIRQLLAEGAGVTAFDPSPWPRPGTCSADAEVQFAGSLEQAVDGADVVVIVTRWREFERVPSLLRELGRNPFVFDGRRMLEASEIEHYGGIGR